MINLMNKKLIIFLTTCILQSFNIMGQKSADSLKGNTNLPSSTEELLKLSKFDDEIYKYSVESYFAKPKQSSFNLSPDGRFISFQEKDKNGKNNIYLKIIATGENKLILVEKENLILEYMWGNNSTILYFMDNGGDENYHLHSLSIENGKNTDLTPFNNVTVRSIKTIKDNPEYVIVTLNKENPELFEPYKINILTGSIEMIYKNDIKNPISDFIFDHNGNLRAIKKQINNTDNQVLYRDASNGDFKEVLTYGWQDNFKILNFLPNSNHAYVCTNIGRDKKSIVLYDLFNRKILKVLFEHSNYDIDDISLSKKRRYEIDYYSYTGEKAEIIPISKVFHNIYKDLQTHFANYQYEIKSITDNEQTYIIYISSDRLYGKYYLYNSISRKFELLVDLMPSLKEEDMAEMIPIKFKSRDGFTIHAYLTIPNLSNQRERVPLIVNPHGGPYGDRDVWGFNQEAQLFASRGYATLQINFRGSGSYGKSFYVAGNKQIGRKMLEDLEDGVKYVIKDFNIDKQRIAIYGASYGGLATLGSLIKTPELYKCGVDYVGVSNLFTFIDSFPSYWKPYMERFYSQWYDPNIPEEKQIMEEVSPVLNIENLNKPLFVIQGANDPRVNINESDQIVKELRQRGFDVPYMVKYNEGHGFRHESNQIELYKTMMGFFAKYLK